MVKLVLLTSNTQTSHLANVSKIIIKLKQLNTDRYVVVSYTDFLCMCISIFCQNHQLCCWRLHLHVTWRLLIILSARANNYFGRVNEMIPEIAGWMLFVATCCLFVWLCYTLYPSIVLFFRQWYYLRGLSHPPPHWLLGHLHVSFNCNIPCVSYLRWFWLLHLCPWLVWRSRPSRIGARVGGTQKRSN